MIPEIWYEQFRFMLRHDDRWSWWWNEEALSWYYGRRHWSLPHQAWFEFPVWTVTGEMLDNIVPELVPALIQGIIK